MRDEFWVQEIWLKTNTGPLLYSVRYEFCIPFVCVCDTGMPETCHHTSRDTYTLADQWVKYIVYGSEV